MEKANRIALVTGGSRGIGRAVAKYLSQSGMIVIVNYQRQGDAAQAVCREIAQCGGICEAMAADVSSEEQVQQMFADIAEKYGRIDVLVNNAGITRDTLLVRMHKDMWDQVLATNLTGAYLCARQAARMMIRQHSGRIVNIASIAGFLGNVGQANYAAAKAGIIGLTRSLARELAPRQITVNAVAPGLIATEMSQALPDNAYQAMVQQIPLGHAGTVEDVAQAVGFLVNAPYITGQTLVVDGGLYMH
ncbi:MAG: 3-oxoacyl-[acyl-carrier-protein] reductase [Firmicutes bacterium]|nr:3-oxoacyl-[acyl-carrier-protein] reductase [Bacillota bacterium]